MEQRFIEDAARELGYRVNKYSGRGMFGRECLGIVVPINEMPQFGATLLQHLVHEFIDAPAPGDFEFMRDEISSDMEELMAQLKDMRYDNFGYSDFVVYFPNIEVTQ